MAETFTFRRSLRIEWKMSNFFSVSNLESKAFSFHDSVCKFKFRRHWYAGKESYVIDMYRENCNSMFLHEMKIETFIEDGNQQSQFRQKYCSMYRYNVLWYEGVSDLRREEKSILTDGVVTFVCMLTAPATHEDKMEREASTQTAENMDPMVWFESLSRDFHNLLDDTLLSDVTLKCGDRTIPAHRNVLSARSEVFLAMFRSDMTESRTGIIEISDIEPSTLYQLVQYIYSGRVSDLSADSAVVLYAAADKYAVDSLKQLCGNFMRDNLTEENACNFLALVDAHCDKDMKNYVLSFIMERELLKDEERWRKFLKEHPVLAAEALHHAYKAK